MPYKAIASLVPIGQSVALASSAFPKKGKKVNALDMTKSATNLIVGSHLLRATAQEVGKL